jgi:hypothetical protein
MDEKAWISLGSAIIAVSAMIATIIVSLKARAVSLGQAETSLRASISVTRQAVRSIGLEIAKLMDGKAPNKLTAEDNRRLQPVKVCFEEAIEDHLNAYENACGQYLDNKVDKARFRKAYNGEVRGLCEDETPEIKARMHPADVSDFKAIWKVYREWHNLEG